MNVPTLTPAGAEFYLVDPNITVQLENDAGVCWTTTFDRWCRNTATKFKTKKKILVK